MDKVLEFLDKRIKYLQSLEKDAEYNTNGLDLFMNGVECGRFEEAICIKSEIIKILENI